MGFKLSYQNQGSHLGENVLRSTMHFFWFVYFTGMIKISAFYSSLRDSPIGFIPIIFLNWILHTGILTVEVPLCVCTGVNRHLLLVKYKKRKLLTCV